MRFNRKRIIAIMIFLLLSFFMMTFGNPAENTAIATRNVKFIDSYDDDVLATEEVELGKSVEAPSVPDHTKLVFTGWVEQGTNNEADFKNILEDKTFITTYDEDENENGIGDSEDTYYIVTFVNSRTEEILKTQSVLVGMSATAPATPAYAGFTFTGWTNPYTNVRRNVTTRTIYREDIVVPEIEKFTVTFVDGDTKAVIAEVEVESGASASTPVVPTHDKRIFSYWAGNYTNVIKDEIVVATYTDDLANYEVEHYLQKVDATFETLPEDIDHKTGFVGDETETELNVYEGFEVGTYKNATILRDNSTKVRVEYKRVTRTITFVDYDETEVSKKEVLNEGSLTENDIPVVPNTRPGYTCSAWDVTDYSNITSDLVVMPVCKKNSYTLTIDPNGGVHDGKKTVEAYTQEFNSTKVINDPTRAGYDFDSWGADGDVTMTGNVFTYGIADAKLTARWTARTDTAYIIEHYKQNIDGTYPSVASETDSLKGTTDITRTIGNSDINTYEGFTYDAKNTNNVLTGKITADGKLVLKLYYARTLHTIEFVENGGSEVTDLTGVRYGATITLPTTTRKGYTFNGWYKEAGLTTEWKTTDTVTANITLYAKWTANNVGYTIEYYQQNILDSNYTKVVADSKKLNGNTDADVTIPEKAYTGFVENTTIPYRLVSGKVSADGKLVLKRYYDRITYKVEFVENGGSEVTDLTGVKYGATITLPATTKKAYDFAGWYKEAGLTTKWTATDTVTANTTLYAKWEARTDTAYKIEHYLQNIDGTYPETTSLTTNLKGTTDTTRTIGATDINTYPGFTYDAKNTNNVLTGKITADGKLVLKLYYTRNGYVLTINPNGGTTTNKTTNNLKFEETLTVTDPTRAGYDFTNWELTATVATETNNSTFDGTTDEFTMGTVNATLTAKWSAKDVGYAIEYYQQNLDDDNYTKVAADSKKMPGFTDANVIIPEKVYEGFVENTTTTDRLVSGKVKADGTLVLKRYYDRQTYTVDFVENGGSAVTDLTGVKYGTKIALPSTTKTKYTFDGWYKEATFTNKWNATTDTIKSNTTIYAKWIAYPQITTTMTASPNKEVVEYNDIITYTLTIKNVGSAAGNIVVKDTGLIAELAAGKIELVDASSDANAVVTANGLILNNFAEDTTKTVTIKVKVKSQVNNTIDSQVVYTLNTEAGDTIDPISRRVEKTINFTEISEKGANIVLVLDKSLSMDQARFNGSYEKFNSMKNAAKDFLDVVYPTGNIAGGTEVCIVAFAEGAEKLVCSTDKVSAGWGKTRAITLAEMKEKITNLTTASGTSYSAAMNRTKTVLNGMSATNELESIIFLSDGEPTQGNDTYYATATELKNADVTIYTIGFEIKDDEDLTRLKTMASSESKFYQASTTNVKDTFKNIATLINNQPGRQTLNGVVEISANVDTTKNVTFTINGVAKEPMSWTKAISDGYIVLDTKTNKYEIVATKFNAEDTIVFTYYKKN